MIRVSCQECGLAFAIPDNRVGDSDSARRCKRCGAEISPASGTKVPRPAAAKSGLQLGARPALTRRAATASAASVKAKHDPIEFDWNDLQARTGPRPIAKVDSGRRIKADASKSWVVELGDGVQEPMQLAELCELFSRRTVGPDTRIRAPSSVIWSRAPDIPELAAALRERGVQLLPRIDLYQEEEESDPGAPTSTIEASKLWAGANVSTEDETAVMDSRRLQKEVFASVAAADPSSESAIPTVPPAAPGPDSDAPPAKLDDDEDLTLLYQKDEEKPLAVEPLEPEPVASAAADPTRAVDPFGPTAKPRMQASPLGSQAPPRRRSRLSNAAFIAVAFLLGAIAFTAAAAATLAAYDLVRDDGSAHRQ
jgi:hypothetical protein